MFWGDFMPNMTRIFRYLVHISENPNELEFFKPLPTYLGVRASKSKMYKVVFPSDPSSPSHQTSLAPQLEVGKHGNLHVDLPPSPPTVLTENFCAQLDCDSDGCHEVLSPCPPSFGPFDPPNLVLLRCL